jgi:hypothetical protein
MKEHTSIFTQIGSALLQYLPAFIGAVISLQFLGKGLSIYYRISSVAIGVACAVYLAPALIVWLGIESDALTESLEFLIGLFAVAIGREIFREIEGGLIQRIRDKFLGGGAQ